MIFSRNLATRHSSQYRCPHVNLQFMVSRRLSDDSHFVHVGFLHDSIADLARQRFYRLPENLPNSSQCCVPWVSRIEVPFHIFSYHFFVDASTSQREALFWRTTSSGLIFYTWPCLDIGNQWLNQPQYLQVFVQNNRSFIIKQM